jgi:hypothetical protein
MAKKRLLEEILQWANATAYWTGGLVMKKKSIVMFPPVVNVIKRVFLFISGCR